MSHNILLVSSLVILWWIAIWGLVDIFLKHFIGDNKKYYIFAYLSMVFTVLILVYTYPNLLESFS
jgi:hypothetical protein